MEDDVSKVKVWEGLPFFKRWPIFNDENLGQGKVRWVV